MRRPLTRCEAGRDDEPSAVVVLYILPPLFAVILQNELPRPPLVVSVRAVPLSPYNFV